MTELIRRKNTGEAWETVVDDGGSGSSPFLTASVDLTAAQIAALGSTPVEVIPGITGRSLIPVGGVFEYFAGTEGFGASAELSLAAEGGQLLFGNVDLDTDSVVVVLDQAGAETVRGAALSIENDGTIGFTGPILTSSLDDGGRDFVAGDTATIDGGTGGLITVSTVAAQFPIVSLVQGAKTFTVTGDASAVITAGTGLFILRSTGNDGSYTVVSSVFGAGQTVITVSEAIPSATADGKAEPDDATGGAIVTYALTTAGTDYTLGGKSLIAVAPSVGVGAAIDVLTITNTSDGTARVTVYYALTDAV